MNRTKIEWALNPDGTQGYTWNPITGCLNGCPYCYARKLANGRLKQRYLANHNYAPLREIDKEIYLKRYAGDDFDGRCVSPFYPRFWPERLIDVPFTKKPLGIFVCDMGELFGDWIPPFWQEKIFKTITELHPEHRFYLLTKQPQNLIKFSPFPDNCWVGVTVTNLAMARRALPYLAQIDAKIKYVSYEPLLERIPCKHTLELVDWVIIGAQTKPYKPLEFKWVEEIIEACSKANIPYFLKDNLAPIIPGHTTGDKLKQEMPEER